MKKLMVVLAGIALLAGCGSGGSGGSTGAMSSGPVYSGVTTQATVSSPNAKSLSADAYTGGQVSAAVSGVAKEANGDNTPTVLMPQLATLLEGAVKGAVGTSGSLAKSVSATAQNTVNGITGFYSYTVAYDQVTGACSGTISFNQYKETATSPAMTGTLAFTGVYSQSIGTFTSLAIDIANITGATATRTFSLAGGLSLATVGATTTVTMTVVLSDNATGRAYWINNYVLVHTGSTLTVSGRYYDPVQGFVVISTVTPLTISAIDAMPTAGQLLFTGVNNTKARLTFSAGSYLVEVDAAGNGTYVVVP